MLSAVVSTEPDVPAFMAGFELAMFIAFALVIAFIGLSILRKIVST